MKKVMIVFGTRPEAIKMCPVALEMKKYKDFNVKICLTGQHKEMLQQVIKTFNLRADYDLEIMKPGQTLFDINMAVLNGMKDILEKECPDLVLVHGDTSTAFAAALACFYKQVRVGHVEAGLRTYNLKSPYPEEFNRQAIGVIADYHFSPTENAKNNLLKEGKNENCVYVTGNTVIDALQYTIRKDYKSAELDWCAGSRLILLTAHRRENLGAPLEAMFRAIRRIADEFSDVKIIYPVHLNPVVQNTARTVLGENSRIHLISPLDVIDFHNYMNKAYLILTDSGGIQEEAPALGKPVLVMRDTTERPEGIEAGTLKLVGTEEENIYYNVKKLLLDINTYEQMSKACNPYGDGHASERICKILAESE